MNKFTLTLAAATLLISGAQAQQLVKAPAAVNANRTATTMAAQPQKLTLEQRVQQRKAAKAHRPVAKAIAGPSADDKVIDTTPAGTLTNSVKQGFAFGYNWFMGQFYENIYSGLTKVVVSDDRQHVYIQNPIYFNFDSKNNWIVGDLKGDEVTFTFPQLIDVVEFSTETYYDYALALEYVEENEEEGSGWYYPTESQTYRFKLEADGSLTSLEQEKIMIGMCNYFEGEDLEEGEEPYWYWQGNGDLVFSIKPNTEVVPEAPATAQFEEWQLLSDITSRPVNVAFDGNDVYVKGLFSSIMNAAVKGKLDGDKVTFETSQYLGEYTVVGTLTWFLAGHTETVTDEKGEYDIFQIDPSITFAYDKENNVLSSTQAYCISSSPEKVLYYAVEKNPYICIPAKDITVTKLLTPIYGSFYPADEETGWETEFFFHLATLDADRHVLPTDRLGYQVVMDDEIFTFYNDEYELPAGVEETTIIPYGYASANTYDFGSTDTYHGFVFHSVGFTSLGVREVYTDANGNNIFSDILWAPGYEGTFNGVAATVADRTVASKTFYNLSGVRVANPEKGVYILRTNYTDGTSVARKVVVK